MSEPTARNESDNIASKTLGPIGLSFLEYVFHTHATRNSSRASLVALLMHARLLSHGARLCNNEEQLLPAVLNEAQLQNDPITLSYTIVLRPASQCLATSRQLRLSVVEVNLQIFVTLTDVNSNTSFGHAEFSAEQHVATSTAAQQEFSAAPQQLFLCFEELIRMIETEVLNPVLPLPFQNRQASADKQKKDDRAERPAVPEIPCSPAMPMTTARPVIYPDIGRADLDPFGGGFGMDPASSGMIFRPNFSGGVGPHFGGPGSLPRGSVPPGARFDPFGPGVVRPRPPRGGPRFGEPDPDHAAPPGADDMYF